MYLKHFVRPEMPGMSTVLFVFFSLSRVAYTSCFCPFVPLSFVRNEITHTPRVPRVFSQAFSNNWPGR